MKRSPFRDFRKTLTKERIFWICAVVATGAVCYTAGMATPGLVGNITSFRQPTSAVLLSGRDADSISTDPTSALTVSGKEKSAAEGDALDSAVTLTPEDGVTYISLNSATMEELMTLPGIGETLASRIIEYRELYGDFYDLEELKDVDGIGEARYEKIFPYLVLN